MKLWNKPSISSVNIAWLMLDRGAKTSASRTDYIRIHEAVQQSVLLQLKPQPDAQVFFGHAVTVLVSSLDSIEHALNDPRTWPTCAKLVPHFQALINYSDKNGLKDVSLELAYARLGWYFHMSGQYELAAKCCSRGVDRLEEPDKSTVREWLSRVYMKMDKFPEAEDQLNAILKRDDTDNIVLSSENLVATEGLATCLYLKGDLRQAADLYQRILALKTQSMDDIQKARVLEGLANVYQRLGNPDDAMELYESSLTIQMQQLGPKFISMLTTMYNRARLFRDLGNFREAEGLLRQVKSHRERLLGEDHPDALLAAARLAYTYARQNKLEEAQGLALQTLKQQEAQTPPQKVAIHYTKWVLADIHRKRGNLKLSEILFQETLKGYEEDLKPNHLFAICVRRDLSDIYQMQGRLEEAVKLLEEVRNDIQGTESAAKLARLYCYQNKLEKAQLLAEQTKELQKRRDGPMTPEINYTLWVLARIYVLQGRKEDAIQHYRWALEGYTRLRGAVFGNAAELATEIAEFLKSLQDDTKGIQLLKDLQPDLDRCGYDELSANNPNCRPQRQAYPGSFAVGGPERDPMDITFEDYFIQSRSLSAGNDLSITSAYTWKQ